MNDTSVKINAIRMVQPIGHFFVGVMRWQDLRALSFADRRVMERELDSYIGIQRKLNEERVRDIGRFVNTIDATFPTSVVLSVREKCVEYDESTCTLILSENLSEDDGNPAVPFAQIAKILDGQHRVEGLENFQGEVFDIPVTIMVEADVADEAYIFATVNLAQTKVNRSLVYDLLAYAKARSPQKTCHEIAVALNRHERSPFKGMIKRLGTATPGRAGETLTQATFVQALLPLISRDAVGDRDTLLRGRKLSRPTHADAKDQPFRNLFLDERDGDIARNISAYFACVSELWPQDWKSREKGNILPRTNGFRAFMRFFKLVYLALNSSGSNSVLSAEAYREVLVKVKIQPGGFTSSEFPPGTSGEKLLFERLRRETGL